MLSPGWHVLMQADDEVLPCSPGPQALTSSEPPMDFRSSAADAPAVVEMRNKHEQAQAQLAVARSEAAVWQAASEAAGKRADTAEAELKSALEQIAAMEQRLADTCVRVSVCDSSSAATQCCIRIPASDASSQSDIGSSGFMAPVDEYKACALPVDSAGVCKRLDESDSNLAAGGGASHNDTSAAVTAASLGLISSTCSAVASDTTSSKQSPASREQQDQTGEKRAEDEQTLGTGGQADSTVAWPGLPKLQAAAAAAHKAARAAEEDAAPRLVAHIAFLTARVAELLQSQPPTGAPLRDQRPVWTTCMDHAT